MIEKIEKVSLDLSFYSGKDLYSDGEIEDELLQIVSENTIEKYPKIIVDRANWPILYHLSPIRENCIAWIDFPRGAEVLEVGAGCGAVTGKLSEKATSVTCVELSKMRSLINATRHRASENINIIVGNFEDIETSLPKYDVVTLIGVLEYASLYIHSQSPYHNFLKTIRAHLKPGGMLIVAIENKLGMKYWAGCREDHTGTFFVSIENYEREKRIRTFSKRELRDLLQSAGYCNTKFYYPYPDYKLPSIIYSDEYLPQKGELTTNLRNFDASRFVLFDESRAFDSVLEAGLFPEFSNSFLTISYKAG